MVTLQETTVKLNNNLRVSHTGARRQIDGCILSSYVYQREFYAVFKQTLEVLSKVCSISNR